jgi:protein tyrosine phosphatase
MLNFNSRLHGHNKLKEFILSQHPTEEVREDFWRMLWDHNAQTVVLLSSIYLEVSRKFSTLKNYIFSPHWHNAD